MMILKSFLLGNLVSLCMKIINSVVMVGLYYGFLTTFSIGPSYLFLLQARVMEEGEEGTEKKVSATTGFIAGQLMMFISIYYAPLHLALGRPHTITVLALPYLLFHFFWNNHKHFFDYGSTTRNSMRNLSIQCVFLNNLIFQLFNHFILPSSMLARLVNIYMFRCNNKMLFVTSSFVGWLIGHIFFMKWVELVLVWIQQNNSIRSNKYLGSELRNSMDRIFSILLFITCVYYLGRIPSPILTKKMKETSETEERGQNEEERDIEIETTFETKGTKQEQEGSNEEDPSPFSEEKEDPNKIDEEIRVNGKEKTRDEFHLKETVYKDSPVYKTSYLDGNKENSKLEVLKEDKLWFEKPLVTLLFDYKRWNRPLRYIKNNRFENAVRNEMSQYFFYTCRNDGKEKISFTYPPSLSTFREMIKRKMDLFTEEKRPPDELYDHWISTNEQKKKNLSKEFRNRIEVLKKGSITLDVLEKKSRLCNDETKKEYLPKIDDPFLNGPYRGRRNIFFSSSIRNETSIKNDIEKRWINKIQGILFTTDYDYEKLEEKIDTFDQNSLSTEKKNDLFPFSKMEFKIQQGRIVFEDQINICKFIFIQNVNPESKRLKEISKKVKRWSYKLIDDLEQQERENEENVAENHAIRSRKAKRVVILNENNDINKNKKSNNNPDERDEMALIRYSQQSDFRRDIIKGSMRAQRHKTNIKSFFQANLHSPLFLERRDNPPFSFDISQIQKFIFKKWKKTTQLELRILDYTQERAKENEKKQKEKEKKEEYKRQEKVRIEIAEAWDSILFAQIIRGSLLVIQSFLRKYILLLSLIVVKNTIRMLVFQFPEWSEDFKDWKKEMQIKCTYNGVPLSETEFPKNWLRDGIQIKILFPFFFKPWHKSKVQSLQKQKDPRKKKNDFCFLTVWGMETDLPFGSPRKRQSFFNPIFKEMKKIIRKWKKKSFFVIRIFLKEKKKLFRGINLSKESQKWLRKNILFIKGMIKELSKKKPNFLVGFKEISELNETKKEKDRRISNQMISESSLPIQSMDLKDFSFTETKMKDLPDRTNTIMHRIKKIQNKKDNKNEFLTNDRNSNCNSLNKLLVSIKKSLTKLKKRNVRLIRKSYLRIHFFIHFIQKIYIKVFLCIIHKNSPRITTQLFELSKNEFDKLISNNEINKEKMNKTSAIPIIGTLKKRFFDITKKNSKNWSNLSYFSQAYVFYQIYKTEIFSLYRDLLQYKETSLFLKKEIKDYFETEGILHLELGHKNLFNYTLVEWKNSLNLSKYYQYELSQIQWYRLVPHKWRNRVNQRSIMTENKDFQKSHSDEKDQFIFYKKFIKFESNSFSNEKKYTINFQKYYKYALFSYQSINYDDRKDSYISVSPLWINNPQENCYNSNIYNIKKSTLVDMSERIIPIYNYIYNYFGQNKNMNLDQFPDKKYFDWKILYLCFRKKGDIHSWIIIDTNINFNNSTNTNAKVNNYPIIGKIDKKDLVYLYLQIDKNKKIKISKKKKSLFDWMGMNEEILSRSISNLKLWFFDEFVLLYNTYKMNPWIIPTKELLFNLNETVSENKNITQNQKDNPFKLSKLSDENKSKSIKLENKNQDKKESPSKNNVELNIQNKETLEFESIFSTQEKDIEEDSSAAGSDRKKRRKRKQYKSNTETELDFFLKRYLRFQLRWNNFLNQKITNNIKVYCLLLRLVNSKEIALSSIQKGEISLDILMIQKDLTLRELMKKRILIIEPVRLSIKNDSQFLMYQTLNVSLVHKSKHQLNQSYREKHYIDRNNYNNFIVRHPNQRLTENRDYDLVIPEHIFSTKWRRELRIRICFNSRNRNLISNNSAFCNNIKNYDPIFQNFYRNKIELIQLKSFLWPTYRVEDLSCMNRYWFDTTNGSCFSLLRIYMYPPLKIRE
uniref:Protein TIC 214 n=1 Tax=Triolena amazonica TaxID=1170342 RepID=A0A1I9VXR5_9MYRT|nr:Ycf1 [Triolena amazonica]APA18988.1 Ycf1 [Triolena amazonica]